MPAINQAVITELFKHQAYLGPLTLWVYGLADGCKELPGFIRALAAVILFTAHRKLSVYCQIRSKTRPLPFGLPDPRVMVSRGCKKGYQRQPFCGVYLPYKHLCVAVTYRAGSYVVVTQPSLVCLTHSMVAIAH